MRQPENGMGKLGSVSARTEEIQGQIQALTGRDLQLWSAALLVILVLAAGFAAFILPNLVWVPGTSRIESRYLPQLFFGLISLILLFNVYLVLQKRELNTTRTALVCELIFNERLESLSLLDPLTGLLNLRAVQEMLSKEVFRANRQGSSLTLLMIDISDFKSVNEKHGRQGGDKLLIDAAQLLRGTFRGSDTVFRYGADDFLVVMPDTNEQQAECAVQRLLIGVERWNVESRSGCELSLNLGLASYVTGLSVADLLQAANRKILLKKNRLVPVF